MAAIREIPSQIDRATLPWARPYQRCTRCLMDTTDWEISFDAGGVCNHCSAYEIRRVSELVNPAKGWKVLQDWADHVKAKRGKREYDCIVGISGGTDSAMSAYVVAKLGLRPLAVHLDNGWNSELAVHNIEKILKLLHIDLHTNVLQWDEFRDLQLAFLKASVPNSEIPTDHAIFATLYNLSAELGIRYIITGGNVATEGIMPRSWCYDAKDWHHIHAINKQFGAGSLKSYPHFTAASFVANVSLRRMRLVRVLNYIGYTKAGAAQTLKDELGWEPYSAKHFENIYTRFFQGYLLPRKFDIDKRKAHFSALIMSGQMDRASGLRDLEQDPYLADDFRNDRDFVLKKFRISSGAFVELMSARPMRHEQYPCNPLFGLRLGGFHAAIKRLATNFQ